MKLRTSLLVKLFFSAFVLTLITTSCTKDCGCKVTYTLSGLATGAQETPPVATKATAELIGTYNKKTKVLQYAILWTGLTTSPVAMHFHGPAAPGVAAPVQIPITGFPVTNSGMVNGTATLTSTQEAQLLAGQWYYNIHTKDFPGGEIRAQVIVL